MTPEEIHAQREMDEDILSYVRGLQDTAPICMESVHSFLHDVRRRRRVLALQVQGRLSYLVSKGYLVAQDEWVAGEGQVTYYRITALGCDVLDRIKPWS